MSISNNNNSMPVSSDEKRKRNGKPRGKKIFTARFPLLNLVSEYRKQNEQRRDYEFMPATLEVLESPPAPFSRAMLLFIVTFVVFAISWASFARMDIVVNAMGVVIPKGKVKVVQPLEPGIVTEIYVRDGQMVQKGDLLISMDNTDNDADLSTLGQELAKSELTVLRLNAQLQDDQTLFVPLAETDKQSVGLHRNLLRQSLAAHKDRLDTLEMEVLRCYAERDAINSDVARLEESLPVSQELFFKKKTLADRKLISKAELLQAQIEITDAQHNLSTAQSRLREVEVRLQRAGEEKELIKTEYRRDLLGQLTEAMNKLESFRNQLAKVRNKQAHLKLRAPADGIVQQLSVHTIGGVVTAAQPLLVVVPVEGGLEIEAKIQDKDIGFILPKQDVSVKVNAYPFTRYGDLEGKIEWVARDAVIDEELGPSYPIRVSINSYTLPNIINGKQGNITPGMTVVADVKVGQRRLIHYFLGPIMRYKDQSLREI